MLTKRFGSTYIGQPGLQRTVGVGRSFVHKHYFYGQILSYNFCLRYFWTTLALQPIVLIKRYYKLSTSYP